MQPEEKDLRQRTKEFALQSRLSPQPVAFYAAVFFFVNVTYILLIWELIEPRADLAWKVRRNMRYRSIATLCLFGNGSLVVVKYPFLRSCNLLLLPGGLFEARCARRKLIAMRPGAKNQRPP